MDCVHSVENQRGGDCGEMGGGQLPRSHVDALELMTVLL